MSYPATFPDHFTPIQLAAVEQQTRELGRQLFAAVRGGQPHVWQRRWWDEKLLAWTMRDEGLKVQLFRFVDVLPMLHSADAVTEHLHEYLATDRNGLDDRELFVDRHDLAVVQDQFGFVRGD